MIDKNEIGYPAAFPTYLCELEMTSCPTHTDTIEDILSYVIVLDRRYPGYSTERDKIALTIAIAKRKELVEEVERIINQD